MGLPRALGAYNDCAQVMDHVIRNAETVRLSFDTVGKAKRFQMRCYFYRKLLLEKQLEESGNRFLKGSTPYDKIYISHKGQELRISTMSSLAATITDDQGNKIVLDEPTPVEEPDAFAAAEAEDNLADDAIANALRLLEQEK